MPTIQQKLHHLNYLYQKRAAHNQEIKRMIKEYEKKNRECNSEKEDLVRNTLFWICVDSLLLSGFLIKILISETDMIHILNYVERIACEFFSSVGISAICTFLSYKTNLGKKLIRKINSQKYKEIEKLSLELEQEKAYIERLKEHLEQSKIEQERHQRELKTFRNIVEEITNQYVTPVAELKRKHELEIEENHKQVQAFANTHTLTKEELAYFEQIHSEEKKESQKQKTKIINRNVKNF